MSSRIMILYGSETGTAQDVAEQIWRDAKRLQTDCSVMAMDDYDIENLIFEKLAIFVVATAGQGDPPMNMRKFWRFLLRRSLPINSLQNLRFGVLGLGDSSYEKYNYAAKKLNRRLAQLGAKEILSIGLADDQHDLGIDAICRPWTDELWSKLSHQHGISVRTSGSMQNSIIMKFDVTVVASNDKDKLLNDIYRNERCIDDTKKIGIVLENTRITSDDHFQDVRLIKFNVNNVKYEPGDVVYVRPKNSLEKVEEFFKILENNGVALQRNITVNVSSKEIRVPDVLKQNLTLWQIAEQYWDLNYKPRRYTMEILSHITDSMLEKEKLIEFTTATGQEELYNYINRPRRNIIEVFNDFPHATKNLNLNLLFEIMVPIKPRAFSIASSSKHTPHEIHILVAVVKYKTTLIEPRRGLCSNWLANLHIGTETVIWTQKGTFNFDYAKPAILIGPGTGIAPFRAFLLEKINFNDNLSDCLVFFGCRNRLKDYHCQKDFEMLTHNHGLQLFCAFSRDQEDKIYVQHKIREQESLCWKFLENGANIYLAGSSKNMPANVRDEFVAIVKKFARLSEKDADNHVTQYAKEGRYQTETWS